MAGASRFVSCGFRNPVQKYSKKKRPTKMGLIYAVKCSVMQKSAEKCSKKVQKSAVLFASFRNELSVLEG